MSGVRRLILQAAEEITIEIKEDVFKTILDGIGLAPWAERLIHCWTYGYHHDVRITGTSVASHYLGTGHFTAMWTTSQNGLECVTKGVIIAQENIVMIREGVRMPIGIAQRLFRTLSLFGDDSRSPFYLPFVFSVDVLTVREDALTRNFSTIREIELVTGHGTWGIGRVFKGQRDTIKDLTARLGSALNNIADIYKHLNMVELIWKEFEALSPESHEGVQASNKSMADAISILRQQSLQARDQAQYLEVRVRSQSSVLFSLLTHEDAKVSIQMANASVELAAAARRDGSSMKTIAVLTMAFLPATFFAAFFSIPSLGWTESDKFPLFWACPLPVTLATFVLWAVVTQRKAVKGAVARLRRFARGRLGTGASSSDGSSLTTLDSSNASFEIEDAD
ncbi:hypothetical protein CONLIGDRAFT_715430 [Coniochaeta ligniaria NRRL 30616]|uniref:Uncharacterized protein n=1 Tax=Coniochaeta ligniaria NRRL 30616 TaxID=1408157 RepID=A0A1J7JH07_9PEZI|nr:hypothetical protein CONLIGDRAFT_715430 [Coniochaeta ligniaria NRRL 30616]